MLKQVLYAIMFVVTTARFADIVYIIFKDNTNLPVPVIVATSCTVVYGAVLLIRKLFVNVTLRQMMAFFVVQSFVIIFNLTYISITCPLKISAMETLIVGTFFDIIINLGVVYFCMKQIRSHYFAVAQPAATSNRHV